MSSSGPAAMAPHTGPLPTVIGGGGWRGTILALAYREYRWYAIGWLCASIGLAIARIATDWLVIEITGSPALLGLVVASQLLPPMFMGLLGGAISDRIQPRSSVIATQSLFALLFAAMGALVLGGFIAEPWILLISVLVGFVSCVDGPSRALLTSQAVEAHALPNAISLNSLVPQIGAIAGSLAAGLAIATLDTGWTMIVAAVGLLGGALSTITIRASGLQPRRQVPSLKGHTREAIRYAAHKPAIRTALLMVGALAVSGLSASALFAWVADTKFESGAAGYSLYSTVGAAGALLGGAWSTRRRALSVLHNAGLLAASGAAWILCGLAPWPLLFAAVLVGASIARILFLIANDTLTQLSVNPLMRGRIVGLYMMVTTGGQAIGSIWLGWLVSEVGGDFAFVVTGLLPLAVAAIVAVTLAIRRFRERGRAAAPVEPSSGE